MSDVTDQFGIISVQGPESKDFLAGEIMGDASCLDDLAFSRFRTVTIGGVDVNLFRLTYVGEVGYELHVEADNCGRVMEALFGKR